MTSPSAALGGSSAGLSGLGAIMQGEGTALSDQAQASANLYKANVALLNKQVMQQNASWAIQSGGAQAQVSGLKSKENIAKTITTQAASGLDVNSGTGTAVRESQVASADYDQNVIRWDASKTSYGYEVKAVQDQAEANLDTAAAANEQKAADFAMTTSYINAAATVGTKFMQASSLGMFS